MRKYRRIIRKSDSILQGYQIILIAFGITIALDCITTILFFKIRKIELFVFMLEGLRFTIGFLGVISLLLLVLFVFFYRQREQVSTLDVEEMTLAAEQMSKQLLSLINDKQITDVLKLSNSTRFGHEMPQVAVWVNDKCNYGYIAFENIANYEKMDREKYEHRISGILSGKYKRFAVVSSTLSKGDTYMLFYFEDMQTSNRFIVNGSLDSLKEFVSEDVHAIRLSKDLTWHTDETPELSVIGRTRSGKSMLCYFIAKLMLIQGWTVEYNSAKYDRYVKEFNGKSTAIEIVERTEYWVKYMEERLEKINKAGKDKYLEMQDMADVAVFFDELGNLNANLETDKTLKKRWEIAINKLSATGASTGIHIIAISQFATKEGFLPSLARVNCSEAVIMLGGAADSADERRYLMPGFADMPKRSYGKGEGVARILSSSGDKWGVPHFYEAPWFID